MPANRLLSRVLAQLGASAYLSRLGFSIDGVDDGVARARLRETESSANRAGMVHGGATASLIIAAAELAAVSTERERHECEPRIAMLGVSFVDAIRASGALYASARVVRRGRDVVHLAAEARSPGAETAATALLVYRLADPAEIRTRAVRGRVATAAQSQGEPLPGSPYLGSAGAVLLDSAGEWSRMALPVSRNEGTEVRVHDGAVVGLADICAAMAAFRSCGEHVGGASATVSLSMAWAGSATGEVRAGARVLGRSGTHFTNEAEVWDAEGLLLASGLICYRVAGAVG